MMWSTVTVRIRPGKFTVVPNISLVQFEASRSHTVPPSKGLYHIVKQTLTLGSQGLSHLLSQRELTSSLLVGSDVYLRVFPLFHSQNSQV